MPTLISATLARLALLYVVLQLILKVFDRGMKGRDPYIKEVVLPDGITSRLSAQPKMIEMLKAVRTCLQEDIKPTLDDDSVCLAAISRPDKPEKPVGPVVSEPDSNTVMIDNKFILNHG